MFVYDRILARLRGNENIIRAISGSCTPTLLTRPVGQHMKRRQCFNEKMKAFDQTGNVCRVNNKIPSRIQDSLGIISRFVNL